MEHIARSFKVSLVVTHPDIDPTVISAALDLTPGRATRAGEPRTTPKGDPLEGVYEFSCWTHEFDTSHVTDLTEYLPSVITLLNVHASFLSGIVRDGGSVELFCGVFADGNWDECFHHSLLRKLSDLGIDLRLDVYPQPDEPDT